MTSALAEGEVLAGRFRLVCLAEAREARADGGGGPDAAGSLRPGEDLAGARAEGRGARGEGAAHSGFVERWVAEDLELDEEVGLLVVAVGGDAELGSRLRAACREARRLRHPTIVPVFDLIRDGERWLIASECVRGRGIAALRDREFADVRSLWLPVLDAFEYAHGEGVLHGGLSESQVTIDATGALRVSDFAIAGAVRASSGASPAREDDIAALVALLESLFAGAPASASWATTLARLREEPPRDIAGLRRALVEPQPAARATSSPPTISVRAPEPPPLHTTRAPSATSPAHLRSQPGPASAPATAPRNIWIATAFGVLLVCALAVVFVLPRLVAPDAPPGEVPPTAGSAAAPRSASPTPTTNAPTKASPEDEARATRLLGEVLNRSEHLKGIAVAEWAPEAIGRVQEHIAAGEQSQAAGDPGEAIARYTTALEELDQLDTRAGEVVTQALESGAGALDALDPPEARRQFELALRVDPRNEDARLGLERATTLEQVLTSLASGQEHEQAGELEAARAAFARAVELDPGFTPAVEAVLRVEAALRESEFERRMAIALAALARRDLAKADENAAAALALRPSSPEARDLRRSVAQKRLAAATTSARRRAETAESREDWRAAADAYGRILELDPSQAFAREGYERSDKRAAMSEKFDAWIATPGLLFDEGTRAEAGRLLETARAIPDPGPRLARQTESMGALTAVAGTPIDVAFESDGLTRVDIRRVGSLGTFDRRQVSLKPGTYVIVGIRRGFRDVRRTVTVLPGQAPPRVVVRCEEKI